MDAQKINKDIVNLVKDLRMQHAPFQRLSGPELHKLFAEQHGHTSAFNGLFRADRVVKDILDTSLEMMDVVSKVWSTDLANVTNVLSQSCPAFQPMKDNLLKDENLVKAMIGNEHYPRLPGICAALEEMRRLARHQGIPTDYTPSRLALWDRCGAVLQAILCSAAAMMATFFPPLPLGYGVGGQGIYCHSLCRSYDVGNIAPPWHHWFACNGIS
jgi:hypothetical protein